MGRRKDSVSLNARIGPELFDLLERFCQETGQPKTVAVERAIRRFCLEQGRQGGMPGETEGGAHER